MPFFLLFCALFFFTPCSYSALPVGNSAWVYDSIYDENGNRIGTIPGLFANDVFLYNFGATGTHKLNHLFPYGGFIKMFCQGSGGTTPTTPCTAETLRVNYNQESTAAYDRALNSNGKTVLMLPIIDGVVGGEYLKNFNNMNQQTANLFADNIARLYCADDLVDGVQFNLEPFDITQQGQIYFYRRIARNFAGANTVNGVDIFGCINPNHPQGRIFSVFTTSRNMTQALASILNLYRNGYVIGSLYSLGPSIEVATPPNDYYILIRNEVKRVIANSNLYGIKFQLGIPAASTLQEFESLDNQPSGYTQLDYVVAALDVINQYARPQRNFLGINLWAFSSKRFKNGKEYKPASPPLLVQAYMQGFLFKKQLPYQACTIKQ